MEDSPVSEEEGAFDAEEKGKGSDLEQSAD